LHTDSSMSFFPYITVPCQCLSWESHFIFPGASALDIDDMLVWKFSLWESCRATAAAPTFFPPAFVTSVDGKFQGTMIDGGAIQNNPVKICSLWLTLSKS
jgi:predicted acylesterase/phospholipase RssA